jgi:hypothetical protein
MHGECIYPGRDGGGMRWRSPGFHRRKSVRTVTLLSQIAPALSQI